MGRAEPYTRKEMNRIFGKYIKPLAKGQRLTLDQWEATINKEAIISSHPKLVVHLKNFIEREKPNLVILPEVILKNKFIYQTKRKIIKDNIKLLKKLKKPVPHSVLVRLQNMEKAKLYVDYLLPSTVTKISKMTSRVRLKSVKGKLKIKIGKKSYSEKQFRRLRT